MNGQNSKGGGGVFGAGQDKNGSSLPWHIPVLDIYVSAPCGIASLVLERLTPQIQVLLSYMYNYNTGNICLTSSCNECEASCTSLSIGRSVYDHK